MDNNKFDRESLNLFSRIHSKRKADKLKQYRGADMNKQEWLDKQVFPEELKQIVRISDGEWPDECRSKVCRFAGVTEFVSELSQHGCREGVNYYSRQQFEQCRAQMTGRPMVEDWEKGYRYFAQNTDGRSWLYKNKPYPAVFEEWCAPMSASRVVPCRIIGDFELVGDWDSSLLSIDESLAIEKIMFKGVDLPGQKKTVIKQGESMKEAHNRMMNGEDIENSEFWVKMDIEETEARLLAMQDETKKLSEDIEEMAAAIEEAAGKNWFRNGAVPPKGELVQGMDISGGYGRVIATYGGLAWIDTGDETEVCACSDLKLFGFDIEAVHEDALNMNNSIDIERLIEKYGFKSWENETVSAVYSMLEDMLNDGCRIIKDK